MEYESRQKHQRAVEDFFVKLQILSDDSFAHLDLKPDGMCKACVIGKHCSGTNYRSLLTPRSTVISELNCLNVIRQKLESRRHVMGVDFTTQPTTHTLFDLGGKTLNDPSEGKPVSIIFNSMIVKVSALRDIS